MRQAVGGESRVYAQSTARLARQSQSLQFVSCCCYLPDLAVALPSTSTPLRRKHGVDVEDRVQWTGCVDVAVAGKRAESSQSDERRAASSHVAHSLNESCAHDF